LSIPVGSTHSVLTHYITFATVAEHDAEKWIWFSEKIMPKQQADARAIALQSGEET
jgi:hypothetical protein